MNRWDRVRISRPLRPANVPYFSARRSDVQAFINRADLACGTTIGPHVAAALGVPTVDVGNPMLSMHSAREMCGSEDHGMMIRVLRERYVRQEFPKREYWHRVDALRRRYPVLALKPREFLYTPNS